MFNKKSRRVYDAINAGSMADIAFLLLIFFLVTTTIAEEQGIYVRLPVWDADPVHMPVSSRNILSIYVNADNRLLVEGEEVPLDQLRQLTKAFILNPESAEDKPSSPRKALVSIINDRGTEYRTYLSVYNELKAAYREMWEARALETYGRAYASLTTGEQHLVRDRIPMVISEAEPF